MGLYDIINSLQQKPDRTKKKILIGLTFLSFTLLSLLWAVSFKKQLISDFDTGSSFVQNKTEEQTKQKILSPLASLKSGFVLALTDIKEKTGDVLSKTEELVGFPTERKRPVYKLPVTK